MIWPGRGALGRGAMGWFLGMGVAGAEGRDGRAWAGAGVGRSTGAPGTAARAGVGRGGGA